MSHPKSTQILSRNARSRRANRHHIVKYRNLSMILFLCGILFILFLFRQVLTEQKKDEKPVQMTVTFPSENIPKDVLSEIQNFPGLLHCWAAYSAQAQIRIGSFQTSAEILGVDLSACPMKITKSAGAKHRGAAPLIVAGEDFFQNLTDEYGTAITKRQAQIFQEKIEALDVEIAFHSPSMAEDTLFAEVALSAPQTENSFSSQAAPNTFSAQDAQSSFTGSFLALAEGDGLYMDASQMKELLETCGLPAGISRVELEIKGEQNAESAKKSLIKAGFIVQ